jgi:phenylalanyl-tRNA synthetase beta chain
VSKSLDTFGTAGGNFAFLSRVKAWGRSAGLNEVINFSFVSERDLNLLGLPQDDRVPVANPLSEDQGVLRSAVAPGLLLSMRHNLAQGNAGLRLFEVSRTFTADPSAETRTAEADRLGILLHGLRNQAVWPYAEEEVDYSDLKGIVEHLLGELKLPAGAYALKADHTFLSPCVEVAVGGEAVGVLGRVLPEIAAEYNGRKDVWLAELDLVRLAGLAGAVVPSFKPLPVFPPVRRDMTLVAPAALSVGAVLGEIARLSVGLIEDVRLIDVYAPPAAEGTEAERNLTFRLTYRHKAKTLSDKEVDKEHGKLTAALVKSLPVRFQQ